MKLHTRRELFFTLWVFASAMIAWGIGIVNWDLLLMISMLSLAWTWAGAD